MPVRILEEKVELKNDGFRDYYVVPVYVDKRDFPTLLTLGRDIVSNWAKKERPNARLSDLGFYHLRMVIDDNGEEKDIEATTGVPEEKLKGFIAYYRLQVKP
ncbi:MAG: hypothetical protein RMJ16_13855 [Thermoguttaceae bacterium]|nr:hypothetical protein [Thermoguttaceae bacterium]